MQFNDSQNLLGKRLLPNKKNLAVLNPRTYFNVRIPSYDLLCEGFPVPTDLGHGKLTLLLTRNTTKVPCIPPSHFTAFCVCPPPSLHEYIFMLGLSSPPSLGGPTSSCVRPRTFHDLHNRDTRINKVLDTTCIPCISGSVATTPFLALCCRIGS